MSSSRLMDNGTNALSTDDSPDEERDTSCWNNIGLDCEQVTDLVDWKPDGW